MYFVTFRTFYETLKKKTERLSDTRITSATLLTVETFTNNLWPCGVFRTLVLVVFCASTVIPSVCIDDYISQNFCVISWLPLVFFGCDDGNKAPCGPFFCQTIFWVHCWDRDDRRGLDEQSFPGLIFTFYILTRLP